MNELLEYRRHLLERIMSAAEEFNAACSSVRNQSAPLEEGGWNVHQLAVHVRDVNALVYGMRICRTVEEENPEFQNFDSDSWMVEHYKPDEPIVIVLDELINNVSTQVEWLRGLPDEAWSRESRHTVYGGRFTMQTWVERSLAHIEEHLETVKKAIR